MTLRSPLLPAVGSLVVLAALVAALVVRENLGTTTTERPLQAHVAASLYPAVARAAAEYEAATGRRVQLHSGASEAMLNAVRFPAPATPGDLFLPADDSYLRLAETDGLIADSHPLAAMRAVLLLPPADKQRRQIASWGDLLGDGATVSVANEGAAVGRLTRSRLTAVGKWRELQPHVRGAGTVTASANETVVGTVDAAIVWDAVARNYPTQTALELPELADIRAAVAVATLKQSSDPAAAAAFAAHLRDSPVWRELGFLPPPE